MALPYVSDTTESGIWFEIAKSDYGGRPALFVDRDGVLIEDTGYVGRVEDTRVLAGAAGAVAECNRLGIPIVVVTNQSGIARGYFDWPDFHAVQRVLVDAVKAAGGRFDAVFACAYHGDGSAPLNHANHPWRKPNPGMLLEAATRMHLDLRRSWIVGDRASDLAAGRAAHLAGGILLSADATDPERNGAAAIGGQNFHVAIAPSLTMAVALLTARNGPLHNEP
jgi:D-glycero-D-manno-heptose 1,7-bisphosphate phosphatase